MGKKIRETILLLVLFVFTILILELTGIREKEFENQVQIPKLQYFNKNRYSGFIKKDSFKRVI